jgi:alpha-tubulin suppressor-like RCC1 family protein
MFGETQVNGYLFTKNDDPIEYLDSLSLSQNTLRARLRESALYSHADITFDKQIDAAWTFKARNQQLTDGNITERTVRKRYNLTKSIPLTVAEVSAYAPLEPRFAGVGRDLTEGRQASPTSGCMVGDCDYTTRGSISAGRYHTCALSSSGGSGLVWCWGRNDDHQLGLSNEDGSEKIDIAGQMIDIRSAIISPVEGLNDKGAGSGDSAISIISGDLHSCAVMNDSSIKCWGSDNYGQLGRANSYYNDTIASSSVSFSSADYVIDSERYAADSGSLAFIALANDTTYLKNVYSIAAGEAHSCALLGGEEESGRVKCWGKNDSGQLGLGSTPLVHLFPAAPLPAANNCTHKNLHCETRARYVRDPLDSTKPLEGVVSLAVGGNSSCAVLKSGRVYCWGANPYGMLGNSLSTDMDQAPTLKPKAVSGISSVWMLSMDSFSSCAISDPGVINCWGLGLDGQLGTGLSQVLASPRLDLSLNRPAAAISHGGKTTCTLSLDQSVSCVGSNSKKQLGAEESAANSLVFKPVKIKETQASSSISLSGAVAITTGLYHSCALLVDGAIACWGDGLYGQRGSSLSGSTYEAPAYASIVINANNPTERFRVSTLSCPAGVRKYLLNEVMSP